MLLTASNFTSGQKRIGGKVSLIIIFSILLTFTMMFRYLQHTFTFPYAETRFDFIVKEFNHAQIAEIQDLSFVESVFPVRLFSGKAVAGNRTQPVDVYAANSFQARDITFFSDRLLIRSSKNLLADDEINPIIIDRNMAKELKLQIGDVVQLPFGPDGIGVSFTVAAISEPIYDILPAVLIIWQGEQRDIFAQNFGDPPYSKMFVKVSDRVRAKDYFIHDYIPMWPIEQGWFDVDDSERILASNQAMLIEREAYLEDLRYDLQYTPPIVVLASVLAFITYLLILLREANKKLISRQKDFSIIYGLGMPKVYFVLYLMMETAVVHMPLLLTAALIVKYVIYDFLMQAYPPWYLFGWYCLGALVLQLVAVGCNGLIMYIKMQKTDIATQLARE